MTRTPVPDPDYGNNVCRRAIKLTNVDGATIGELEDSVHAIRCRIEHAAGRITRIEAEFVRQPMSTCGGALAVLDDLVGLALGTTLADFYADGKARRHCTHAYDLVWYAIAHAGRDEAVRRYDSIVPDHPDGRQVQVQLLINDRVAIDLQVANDVILSPAPYAGQHLRKGFVGWAMSNLAGEELDAALVLHKGYFVGQSHIYLQMPGPIGEIARRFEGACYTYTAPRIDITEQLPSRRYFPDGEGLLEIPGELEMKVELGRIGIVSGQLSFSDSPLVDEAAAELDALGFGTIWIPGGLTGSVHTKLSRMLAVTRRCAIATGILNIWKQPAAELGAWWRDDCADRSRILLGLGVSHGPFIGADYARPLAAMRDYLDQLDAEGIPADNLCLAALAPKMLELSRTRTAGTHPYLVPPEHSAWARERLGPDALLAPEQGVILETDPAEARRIARANLATYMALPNYVNNWRRLGFSEEDVTGPTDRLIDALFAWGPLDRIKARIDAHFAAGADHVALQVIQSEKVGDLQEARIAWRELAVALL